MQRYKACLISVLVLIVFSVGVRVPRTDSSSGLQKPLNMSLQDSLLVVSDAANGVHVYNVGDLAAPVHKLHIPLEGNTGTALKDNVLYANGYGTLYVIRLEGDSYEVVNSIESRYPPMFDDVVMRSDYGGLWSCSCAGRSSMLEPKTATSSGPSTGSSYATFAVVGSYLYYLNLYSIVTMDITDAEHPVEVSRVPLTGDIETLFPAEDYLFVGGGRGMYILGRSDPGKPALLGLVQHFEACDPVVVADTLAFVTLRSGNGCGQTRSVLLSVNIKNPANPVILTEKPVLTPYGLTIDERLLYLSSGQFGFGLIDVTSPAQPFFVAKWPTWPAKDFIWRDNTLFVMGFDDLKIFDVSVPDEPVLISSVN